ncbi:transposase [Streptomyces lydicus]|uniref:transposase n=1 Tax=Streptomyces lydicus TaxID=47763 RepID=UPI0037A5112A
MSAWNDVLFESCDALLCADGPVRTLVDLALAPEHRRGHGALYDGLNQGRNDIARLRRALAGCRCRSLRAVGPCWPRTSHYDCSRTSTPLLTGPFVISSAPLGRGQRLFVAFGAACLAGGCGACDRGDLVGRLRDHRPSVRASEVSANGSGRVGRSVDNHCRGCPGSPRRTGDTQAGHDLGESVASPTGRERPGRTSVLPSTRHRTR